MTSRICPNPKIGSYMFLGLFIVAELIGFVRASLQDLRLRILFTGGIDVGVLELFWHQQIPPQAKTLKKVCKFLPPCFNQDSLGAISR
jgi:hypothetical protein